jgi:hypothetical protein
MNYKKLLFCILDSEYSVSNRIQHQIISSFCDQREFTKGFYGAEDPSMIEHGLYFESKINTLDPKYGGIIIFSIHQYRACVKFFSLVKTLVTSGKIFCAASENIVIASEKEFDNFFEFATVSTISYENRRNVRNYRGLAELNPIGPKY